LEGESSGGQWIKRIRWARTGHQADDGRINAVASLWVEGTLRSVELPDELREAVQAAARKSQSLGADFSEYVKAARVAAEWLGLAGALDFATQQRWQSVDERRLALDMMAGALAKTASSIYPGPNTRLTRWWQSAHSTPSGSTTDDQRTEQAVARWIDGRLSKQQLIEELVQVQREAERRKPARPSGLPDDQISDWAQCVRLAVKSMIVRTAADYAEAQRWVTAGKRREAIQMMDQALAHPISPPQGGRSA
jgi:predicted amino acid dehydrogenase